MKSVVLCFALVAIVSLMVLRVEASSMPRCSEQCDQSRCPAGVNVNCQCGTTKDYCGCCEYCRVCPREACHVLRNDVCAEGHYCAHPAGSDYIYKMNNPGVCLPNQE